MTTQDRTALAALVVIAVVAVGAGWAGSQGGARVGDVPVFAVCAVLAFAVNAVGFVHAYLAQTERYFDLLGAVTYLTVTATAVALGGGGIRATLLAGFVIVWAVRLGTFLFRRVRATGGDGRFDELKPSLPRFLMTWMLQGLWVLLTAGAALAAMAAETTVDLGAVAVVGSVVWLAGFLAEAAADAQKSRFRAEADNEGRFITSGLWAWSRHPNYFGEIVLWLGVAIVAAPALDGAARLTLISPLFVYVLLSQVSGVPLLEARGKRRWGDDPAYREYVASTPTLVPRPPRRR